MPNLFYILFISWVVCYADFNLTKHNFKVVTNGYGSLWAVLMGKSASPMQYRVLIPWICHPWFRKTNFDPISIYCWVRWVSITFSIAMSYIYFGAVSINPLFGISVLALYFIWAALYDYTDVYMEIGFFSLAFWLMITQPTYGYSLLAFITIVATLNRETAVFIPITALLFGQIEVAVLLFVGFGLGYSIPRLAYGKKERYCEFSMLKRNIEFIIKNHKKGIPFLMNEYNMFFALTVGLFLLYVNTFFRVGLSPIDISMGVLFLLLLIPTMWREIRVFAPTMLAVIPMALRG